MRMPQKKAQSAARSYPSSCSPECRAARRCFVMPRAMPIDNPPAAPSNAVRTVSVPVALPTALRKANAEEGHAEQQFDHDLGPGRCLGETASNLHAAHPSQSHPVLPLSAHRTLLPLSAQRRTMEVLRVGTCGCGCGTPRCCVGGSRDEPASSAANRDEAEDSTRDSKQGLGSQARDHQNRNRCISTRSGSHFDARRHLDERGTEVRARCDVGQERPESNRQRRDRSVRDHN